jgi:hypothetical protein
MTLYVSLAISLCGLVALVLLYPKLRVLWLSEATNYYSVRMIAHVGYGTAWLFWLMQRLAISRGECALARDSARLLFTQAAMGRVDGASLHRHLLDGFGTAFVELGVPEEVAAGIVATLRRKALRREQERLLFFSDDESREVLMLLNQSIALARDPPTPPRSPDRG